MFIPTVKGNATSELAVVAPQTFQTPILIERASASTRKKFFEFFTVPIRNANTRAAYYRAIQQFFSWCERAGYGDLEDIEPITVAAYIETGHGPLEEERPYLQISWAIRYALGGEHSALVRVPGARES